MDFPIAEAHLDYATFTVSSFCQPLVLRETCLGTRIGLWPIVRTTYDKSFSIHQAPGDYGLLLELSLPFNLRQNSLAKENMLIESRSFSKKLSIVEQPNTYMWGYNFEKELHKRCSSSIEFSFIDSYHCKI